MNEISRLNIEETIALIDNMLRNAKKNRRIIKRMYTHLGKLFYDMAPKIDTREKQRGIRAILTSRGWKVVTLKHGDYVVTDILAIERKESDLFSSIWSKKMFQQLEEIRGDAKFAFLVINRNYNDYVRELKKRKLSPNIMHGFVAEACIRGFPPVFTGTMSNFADVVYYLSVKAFDNKDRSVKVFQRQHRHSNDDLNILAQFPGISIAKAEALLDHFGTLFGVLNKIHSLLLFDDYTRKVLFPNITDRDIYTILDIVHGN